MKTPHAFAMRYIFDWEDGGSTDPNKTHSMVRADGGNWSSGRAGVGVLVGSNHGVTPKVLAQHRKVDVSAITYAIMHALTIDEAADIALEMFYVGVHLDRLDWGAVPASIMDFGWGAGYNKKGQYRAIIYTQHMIGASEDGKIGVGGETVQGLRRFIANRTEVQAAQLWSSVRLAYYEQVILANPAMAYARGGWQNRTLSYTPNDPQHRGWWDWFHA